ncbi:mono/diheme cytochrome c family protein [Novosphingobium hassiacum]|uniref:Mono/diheme cytochrome c family protein n=1 Tax=Novosphingobium hassiacum TaxID=173676 RepID=A0A7W5ZZ95_9SPHN|nr:cytochrome C [Novosphingobium hassiacum]MBB3860400.1 mono/diheme cytochrome c family protein [Novosphingobium hassiacum]
MMKPVREIPASLCVIAALAVLATSSAAVSSTRSKAEKNGTPVAFVMPDEATPAELGDAGAEIVVANCATCHSLEYITTQPRGMGPKFWQDSVAKMVKVYSAPIEPVDADAIAATLAKRFG